MHDQPHDPDAEKAVLGSALLSPTALIEVAPLLTGTDFYTFANELVWDAITALHAAGTGVDPITTAAAMTQAGTLARAGGALYLHELTSAVITTTNARHYADIVREKAALRRLITAHTRGLQLAHSGEGRAADMLTASQEELAAAYRTDPSAGSTLIGDLLDDAIDAIEQGHTDGIPWPWVDANRTLNPASPGQVILFAARPSVGKSVAMVDVARHAALVEGKTVVLHSLEMSATEIIHRILAAEARVPLSNIKSNSLSEGEWARVALARQCLAAARLHIVDDPDVGLADIQATVSRHGANMVVLDYIQLAKVDPKLERRLGLEALSRGLKKLAKSAGIPIVMAAQLNRGPAQRGDARPMMSDLRETGALEQDADVVVLLHRPDQLEPECERAGEVDLIVAKQRNGETKTITLVHQLHYSRFRDYAHA